MVLLVLQLSDVWLADGTFSTAPRQYLQLYSIHGQHKGKFFPLVYIFMTRRTQLMYSAVFSKLVERAEQYGIDLHPGIVSTDLEKAVMNAFSYVFPQISIKGCHFHLS